MSAYLEDVFVLGMVKHAYNSGFGEPETAHTVSSRSAWAR